MHVNFERSKMLKNILSAAIFFLAAVYSAPQLNADSIIKPDSLKNNNEVSHGGIIRFDRSEKVIHLVFTGHEFADGYKIIKDVLERQNIKASFFFTGDFYRNGKFAEMIKGLKEARHYLGAHSDKHLLYNSWENRDSTLVTKDGLIKDILDNYKEMKKFGIDKEDAKYFMPPYEWYNSEISSWINEMGLTVINYSAGTYSNGDWTIPEMNEKYYSSDFIYKKILAYEENDPDGLNGFILLTHIGTDPRRTDKFYNKLEDLITELKKRGYSFKRLD